MNKKMIATSILIMMLVSGLGVISPVSGIETLEETTFTYQFHFGWNLITLPLEVEDNSFHGLFDELIAAGNMTDFLYWWNSSTQIYEIVDQLEPGYGYWVYLYDNLSYGIVGDNITSDLSIKIGLPHNYLGWIHDYNITAEHICQSIPDTEIVAICSANSSGDYNDVEYIYHYPGEPDTNFEIARGMGFCIKVNSTSVWNGSVISNLVPIPKSGGPYIGQVRDDITLDGSQSFDFDGEIVDYNWSYEMVGSSDPRVFIGEDEIIEYSWESIGSYNLSLRITDDIGAVAYDNTTVEITEKIPLNISIQRFSIGRVVASIKNIDKIEASNIEWNITVKGGIFNGLNLSANGTIEKIDANSNIKIFTERSIKGRFGKININVTTNIIRLGDDPIKQYIEADGFVIGRIILLQPFSFSF